MESGRRDEPIYFERPTNTNTDGVARVTWSDMSGNSPPTPDWAYITTQRGNEAFEAARNNVTEIIRLCVGYRDDVESTCRMKWNDQYYYFIHVDRSKRRNSELWLTAKLAGAA